MEESIRQRNLNNISKLKESGMTPEQNGVVERLNRTFVESARSMSIFLNAQRSKYYWAEAISTAIYLMNRSPTFHESIKHLVFCAQNIYPCKLGLVICEREELYILLLLETFVTFSHRRLSALVPVALLSESYCLRMGFNDVFYSHGFAETD